MHSTSYFKLDSEIFHHKHRLLYCLEQYQFTKCFEHFLDMFSLKIIASCISLKLISSNNYMHRENIGKILVKDHMILNEFERNKKHPSLGSYEP